MNRITLKIDLSDDVNFSPKDVPKLIDLMKEIVMTFDIKDEQIYEIKAFQEIKKIFYK